MNDRTNDQLDALGNTTAGVNSRFLNLSRLVDRAAGAFGGVIAGAPRQLSDFAGGLSALIGVGGPVARAVKFAEGYVGVWQGLTQYGVNFGNQLDQMIVQTGRANMQMEQLSKMVQQNSVDFAGLGGTANRGVQEFLSQQARFFQGYQDLDMGLRQLGLTTDQINDRFLQFDAMSAVNNIRGRLTERQRMESGARFAESVDRLARLTGKQADELARQQLEASRQGNIYARDQELMGKATQGSTARIVTRFNAMGEDVGRVVTDFLTRGFPDANDPAFQALNQMAPQLQNYMSAIRRAQDTGNIEELNRLENEFAAYMGSIRTSRRAQYFAQLGSANEMTAAANRILTGMNNSAELLSDAEIRMRIANDRNIQVGEVTNAMVSEYRQQQVNLEREGQRSGQGSRQVLDLLLTSLQQLQLAAQPAQETAVRTIFTNIQDAAGALRDGIAGIDWNGAINAALSQAIGVTGLITGTTAGDVAQSLQNMQSALTTQSRAAETQGQTANATFLGQQADRIGDIYRRLQNNQLTPEQARAEALAIEREITAQNMTVNAIGGVTLNVQDLDRVRGLGDPLFGPRNPQDGSQNAIGTLGRTGAFFADFGSGTNVRLDGLEGVFRPNHIEDIMARSSRGTIQALVNDITSRGFSNSGASSIELAGMARNIVGTLDSRLNTLRTTIRNEITENQSPNSEMIVEQLGVVLGRMPLEMRNALEAALENTLTQPLQQLVTASTRGSEFQEKTYKNTRGINSNILSGA